MRNRRINMLPLIIPAQITLASAKIQAAQAEI